MEEALRVAAHMHGFQIRLTMVLSACSKTWRYIYMYISWTKICEGFVYVFNMMYPKTTELVSLYRCTVPVRRSDMSRIFLTGEP